MDLSRTKTAESKLAVLMRFLAFACSLSLGTWAFLTANHTNSLTICDSDSCIFSTFGLGWLNGLLPYKDLFDHKGPAIFFYNLAGYWLTGEFYGIAILELVAILAFIILFFFLNTRHPTLFAFFLGFMLWQFYIPNLEGGNYTEEFSIMFDAIAAFFYFKSLPWRFLVYGACSSAAFFFRPNLAAFTIILFVLDLACSNQKIKHFLQAGIAFILIALPICAYFFSQGALKDMFEQMIIFNLHYAKARHYNLLETMGYFIQDNRLVWLITLPLFGLLIKQGKKFFIEAIAYVFIPFILYTMSGRLYDHYILAMMPSFFLLFSAALKNFNFPELLFAPTGKGGQAALYAMTFFFTAIIGLSIWQSLQIYKDKFNQARLTSLRNKLATLGITDKSKILNLTIHHNDMIYLISRAAPYEKEFNPATVRITEKFIPYLSQTLPDCPPGEYDFIILGNDQSFPSNCNLLPVDDFPLPLTNAICYRKKTKAD